MKKKLEEQLTIHPTFKATLAYIAVVTYLVTFVLSGLLNYTQLHRLLTFDVSSGVFWLFIILIIMGNIDFFREIVKDVARTKVSEFASTEYYTQSFIKLREDLLKDYGFRIGVGEIEERPSSLKKSGFYEADPSTSANKAKRGE